MKQSRLDQITNDISEEMNYGSHSKQEYREVIAHLMDELAKERIRKSADATRELMWQLNRQLRSL